MNNHLRQFLGAFYGRNTYNTVCAHCDTETPYTELTWRCGDMLCRNCLRRADNPDQLELHLDDPA